MTLNLWFDHGLGDCAYFAHILQLYKQRGYAINLHCADDKAIVFAPLNVTRIPVDYPGLEYVRYPESGDRTPEIADRYWLYNKPGTNVAAAPLPDIGSAEELWDELCQVRLNMAPFIAPEHRRLVASFLAPLARPVVLMHSMGNTFADWKNIPPDVALRLYQELLDRTDGTLVLLDWDSRVPRMASWRVRHMTDDWQWIGVATLIALFQQSDLLISVDSGPLHLARTTDIPAIGVFPTLNKYPCRVSLPRPRTVNIVPRDITHECNEKTRIRYNILEAPGGEHSWDTAFIADTAARVLAGPRYLSADNLGADIQLQQFVMDWERGHPNDLTQYNDRHRGYDVLFREVRARFDSPRFVETGCIRSSEDWRGSGFGTYLLGTFTHRFGGEVVSVDIDSNNCEFARSATRELRTLSVVNADSVEFLREFNRPIDVLILDSMDTWIAGHEDHALRELQAAFPMLHERSLVVLDDTVYKARHFIGKGSLAVAWLLDQGWRILHSGYQTICVLR